MDEQEVLKCPTCQGYVFALGVQASGGLHPDSFYDEAGRFHRHSDASRTRSFACVHGHRWAEDLGKAPCPSCPWPAEGHTASPNTQDAQEEFRISGYTLCRGPHGGHQS